MNGEEKRWHSEVRMLAGAVAFLLLLCVALIAQTFWGNGAMLAILGAGLVVWLVMRHAPGLGRHHPTAH